MGDRYYRNYSANQYEDYCDDVFLYSKEVIARYIEQEEPTYKGNLLIEALPPIKDMEDLYNTIERVPLYSDEERKKSQTYRLHAIYRLEDYLLPISKHSEIEHKISVIIRRGYVNKKLMSPDFIKNLYTTSELLNSPNKITSFKNTVAFSQNNKSSSSGFSIIGISGAGKSTAVNSILASYPQNILHTGEEDQKYIFKQVPWIKIDCTHNGSLKGLCHKFFAAMDKVLGSNYISKYGNARASIDTMIVSMAHIAQKHALGLLVIDEIQHLRATQQRGESALSFFVTMMNEIKLPILFIGTYKAVDTVLAKDFRQARRASGIGEVEWNCMLKDIEWEYFIEDIWNYQWTKEYTELTQEIKDMFYRKTMGIIDRIVKLFMAVQYEAIISGQEKITVKLIEKVADEKFPLTKKMMEALESGDYVALSEFDDIKSISMRNLYKNEFEKIALKEQSIEELKNQRQEHKVKKGQLVNEVVSYLSAFEYEYKNLLEIATDVVNEYVGKKDIAFIKRECIRRIMDNDKPQKIKENKSKVKSKKVQRNEEESDDYEEFAYQNIKGIKDGI